MSRVAIILVNWNGWRDTVECLESLQQLYYSEFRVVVCDNGSVDGSLNHIRNWADSNGVRYVEYQRIEAEAGGCMSSDAFLTLINIGENLGFAGGNNVGLRSVIVLGDCDYCWLLNNDTVVDSAALTYLVARMQEQENVGICGSTVLHYHNRNRIQALGGGCYCRWIGLPWHYGRFFGWFMPVNQKRAESWMNYVEGASMLVSQQFLDEIGLMSEDYFLYFEEADWAIRAKGRFKLGYAPQSKVYHKVGRSIGTTSNPFVKSFTCDYYNIRNRIFFARRFHPVTLPTIYLVLMCAVLIRLVAGKFDHVVMILGLMFDTNGRTLVALPDQTIKS